MMAIVERNTVNEVGKDIDQSGYFFERLPYEELIKLYLRSNLHVYLSNSFVLS